MSNFEIQALLKKDRVFLAEIGLNLEDLYTAQELELRAIDVKNSNNA